MACTAARISKHLPVDVVESRRNVLYQAISLQIFTLLGAIEPVVAEAASRFRERGSSPTSRQPHSPSWQPFLIIGRAGTIESQVRTTSAHTIRICDSASLRLGIDIRLKKPSTQWMQCGGSADQQLQGTQAAIGMKLGALPINLSETKLSSRYKRSKRWLSEDAFRIHDLKI